MSQHHRKSVKIPEQIADLPSMEELAALGAVVTDIWQTAQEALDGKQPYRGYLTGFRTLTGTAWLAKPNQKNGRTSIVEIGRPQGYWELSSYSVEGIKRLHKHPGSSMSPVYKDVYPLMQGEPTRREVYATGKDGMPDRLINAEVHEPVNLSQCQIMQAELMEVLKASPDTAARIGSIAV